MQMNFWPFLRRGVIITSLILRNMILHILTINTFYRNQGFVALVATKPMTIKAKPQTPQQKVYSLQAKSRF